jgi:RNA polymerase sigma-70 factor (ECF subfamily)
MHASFKQGDTCCELKGEESAYDALLRCFERPVFNIVSRLVDDPSDAARAVEKVFRKAFRNSGTFHREGTAKLWIYRLAVSEARHQRRWLNRLRHREVTAGTELQALIEDALRTINPKLRVLLVLREIEGLSYEEISAILGVSVDTVKSQVIRGRDSLRKKMGGRLNRSAVPDWSVQLVD